MTQVVSEDGAAEAVDEGVVAAVAHGQPVREEEDEVDVVVVVDVRSPDTDNEVEVVGEPADGEDHHHQDQHLDDLPLLEKVGPVLPLGHVPRGGAGPEPGTDGDVGGADDGERDEVLDRHAGTAVHVVPQLRAGGGRDEAEGSLHVVLVHDVEGVEEKERRGEEESEEPESEEDHLGVPLARSVAQRSSDSWRGLT